MASAEIITLSTVFESSEEAAGPQLVTAHERQQGFTNTFTDAEIVSMEREGVLPHMAATLGLTKLVLERCQNTDRFVGGADGAALSVGYIGVRPENSDTEDKVRGILFFNNEQRHGFSEPQIAALGAPALRAAMEGRKSRALSDRDSDVLNVLTSRPHVMDAELITKVLPFRAPVA